VIILQICSDVLTSARSDVSFPVLSGISRIRYNSRDVFPTLLCSKSCRDRDFEGCSWPITYINCALSPHMQSLRSNSSQNSSLCVDMLKISDETKNQKFRSQKSNSFNWSDLCSLSCFRWHKSFLIGSAFQLAIEKYCVESFLTDHLLHAGSVLPEKKRFRIGGKVLRYYI
jgi:hypothetical protein